MPGVGTHATRAAAGPGPHCHPHPRLLPAWHGDLVCRAELSQREDSGGTRPPPSAPRVARSEEHTSELQSLRHLVCRLLLEKKKKKKGTVPVADVRVRLSSVPSVLCAV